MNEGDDDDDNYDDDEGDCDDDDDDDDGVKFEFLYDDIDDVHVDDDNCR